MSDRFALAVPTGWHDGGHTIRRLHDAADLPWIWIPREGAPDYHDQVVACCHAAGFAPEARHLTSSITSQLAMVGCGLGVALVPDGVARQVGHALANVRLLPPEAAPIVELAAVWRDDGSPLVAALLDSIRRAGSTPPPPGPQRLP